MSGTPTSPPAPRSPHTTMSQEWEVSEGAFPDPTHLHSVATAACGNTATARRSSAGPYLEEEPPRRHRGPTTRPPPRATVRRPIPRRRVTGVAAPLAALGFLNRTARCQ